ncbi:unnamed protein product [Linum tenue]|uniref:Uncharacterized protein n=1 Tax=Linum tenue TaxID=586396 RepID=A0AAV0JG96_9ROSI|nr:unnamed protein product [Linum tenue]
MAATHFSMGSLVLVSALLLVAIAAAENYNPATTTTTSEGAAPVVKPDDKPAYHNGYVSTPALEKLKSKMHQYEHGWKPEEADHQPKSGNGYGSKSESVHPEPRTNQVKPSMPKAEKPKVSSEKKSSNYGAYGLKPEHGFPIGVEGVVVCKSGSDYHPLQGAVVRITCSGEEEEHKVLCSTDEKGYLFKTLRAYGGKPELCKAFLEKSASEKCGVPTDVNKGINGAPLSSYKILHDKHVKLYPIGPFFYSGGQPNAQQQRPSKSPAGY